MNVSSGNRSRSVSLVQRGVSDLERWGMDLASSAFMEQKSKKESDDTGTGMGWRFGVRRNWLFTNKAIIIIIIIIRLREERGMIIFAVDSMHREGNASRCTLARPGRKRYAISNVNA